MATALRLGSEPATPTTMCRRPPPPPPGDQSSGSVATERGTDRRAIVPSLLPAPRRDCGRRRMPCCLNRRTSRRTAQEDREFVCRSALGRAHARDVTGRETAQHPGLADALLGHQGPVARVEAVELERSAQL